MTIRPYRPGDRADIYDVCVRTGRTGLDATGLYSTDDLLPDIYALPYVDREPELAFVVDNGERVVGYVIATADTREFALWFAETWWPTVAHKYSGTGAAEAPVVEGVTDPRRMLIDEVDEYPAHLHIDLLPDAQGQGFGRRLVDALRAALAERGVRGLHLTMGADNVNAGAFYERLGFSRLASSTRSATTYGMPISVAADAGGQGNRIGLRSNQ
ncbi:GNAT family N-acetyltransferase [Mycetocola zhujimingii]|uniref:N-acetyltransferase n=1 Tax=Mycetocola zhujimingii TaxID=2079792 RepID=A0A2U1TFP0_9MICO|nr:GNAT family N-acetyltransferase [Mycetocola zhujimingii]AWB85615.1 GNAT family N-acetyltransferase [Mycetocola zhujimingii]PWC07715.1 N-acetyltransferase [Mycetocola zhujimingii]